MTVGIQGTRRRAHSRALSSAIPLNESLLHFLSYRARLQPVHSEPYGAGAAAEREDQRGEHEAVSEAEEGRGQRGGQVQSQSGRAGLRYLRESGGWSQLI